VMNGIIDTSRSNGKVQGSKDPSAGFTRFDDPHWARVWLILRAFVGWEWAIPGWWGLDRWLTPAPGTPGRADHSFLEDEERAAL
jgi:hypothetical protein